MDEAVLKELTNAEWKLRGNICKELEKDIHVKKLNLFGALYPYELEGTIFYLADMVDFSLFNFLIEISDCIIVPISPRIDILHIKKAWGSVDHLQNLWDIGKVLPMLSAPYESYVDKDFLDPLLEKQPPCGAVRSNILLRTLVGDSAYNKVSNIKIQFTDYMPGSYRAKMQLASILTELTILGQISIVEHAEMAMGGNFKAGFALAWNSAKILTVPTVSGFGSIFQSVFVEPTLQVVQPWGEITRHSTALKALCTRFDPKKPDTEELKHTLLELDEKCKKGIDSEITLSLQKIERILGSNGKLNLSIFLGSDPRIDSLRWARVPLIVWNVREKPTHKPVETKEIRPGDPVTHPLGITGTLGGFGLDSSGSLVPFTARHVSTAGYSTKFSTFFFGRQEEELQYVTFNLRIRRLDEDLPAVLKKPIEMKRDMRVIMVGLRRLRNGMVLKKKLANELYHFAIRNQTFPLNGKTLFTVRLKVRGGDSGALILSEDGRFPMGMVIASDREDPNVTYCHRLIDILPRFGIQGIFCPLGIPENSSALFREVVASLVPDGLFMQDIAIISKNEQEILEELGVKLKEGDNYENVARKVNNPGISIGNKAFFAGRLALNEEGEIIGIRFATSGKQTVVQPVERIERALNLKLLRKRKRGMLKRILKKLGWHWHACTFLLS